MSQEVPPEISAEVILVSESGRSLAGEGGEITSETVTEYTPSADVVTKAVDRLRRMGFQVSESGVTVTIVGEPARFEDAFKTKLTLKRHRQSGDIVVHADRDPSVPESLRGLVEAIVFPEPPEFFR